jgi:multidrug efflux pump subunit AcrA (membrane-fusion protein)
VAKRVRRRKVKQRSRRRRLVAPFTALLAVATVGAVIAAVLVVGGSSSGAQVSERTVTVSKGVIQTVVSGSGNLAPSKQQDVDFATSGKVTKIYVHEGERLDKGDLIARVDSSSQRVAVAKAQADLVDAEDALTDAQTAAATPTPTAVAVAAQASPTPTRGAGPQATPTATPVATATAAPQQQQGSGQSVQSAEANVQSAQLSLTQAQDDLEATELRAPIAGTVAELNGAVGDTAGTGSADSSAFVVLANLHRLTLPVSLSESDIGKVHKGQSATVTINAASGEKVAAHVTSVGILSSSSSDSGATGATGSSGAVSYPVTLTLDQSTQGIKAGMSATADIVVAQASGLMVPTQALSGSTVTVERKGARSTQRVETGVVGDSVTQVVSGLQAGDKVVVTSTTAALGQAAQRAGQGGTTTGPGGFGGAGGFGGPGGLGGGGFGQRFQQRGG